jgi:2-alkenal reductase
MRHRTAGWIILALVLLAGFLLARQGGIDFGPRAPAGSRPVEVRAPLPDAETLGIRIFAEDSPAVVQVVGQTAASPTVGLGSATGVQTGSGFVWDAAGHIVTNDHVVEGTARISVRLASGDVAAAEVVGTAPTYDLAVLRVAPGTPLPAPIALGSSADLKVGQYVFAIGNPFGLGQTMTSGMRPAPGCTASTPPPGRSATSSCRWTARRCTCRPT